MFVFGMELTRIRIDKKEPRNTFYVRSSLLPQRGQPYVKSFLHPVSGSMHSGD